MKKLMVGIFCLLVGITFVSIGWAETPQATPQVRKHWVKAIPSTSSTERNMGSGLPIPNVYIGHWWNGEKYEIGFFANEIDPSFIVFFFINETRVSSTKPMTTESLTEKFEIIAYKEVASGAYIKEPGEYSVEVRVEQEEYGNWYISYQRNITVPPFEAWIGEVCKKDGKVFIKIYLEPFFDTEINTGDTLSISTEIGSLTTTIQAGESLYYPHYVEFNIDESWYINNLQGQEISATYCINEKCYDTEIYFYEPWNCDDDVYVYD